MKVNWIKLIKKCKKPLKIKKHLSERELNKMFKQANAVMFKRITNEELQRFCDEMR